MKKIILSVLLLISVPLSANDVPFKTLNLIQAIQGEYTLGGMHNKEPNSDPLRYTSRLIDITGRIPALHSADFLFAAVDINNRQTMINEIIEQWNSGAAVNLMWHACSPLGVSPCQWEGGVITSLTDNQWNDLLTEGTVLNNRWKQRMDEVAGYLQQLEDAGVEVMFRPFHEMNQSVFWWGGRPGSNGTAKLYQMTHDYFNHTKGLKNLIWVWNLQDFSSLAVDVDAYDPGEAYWGIFSLDMYWSDGQGYSAAKYDAIRNKAGGRPIGIGEAEDLPSPTLFENGQSEWTFFMGWSELVFNNSNEKLNNIFHSPKVVTRDEMPGWDNLSYQVFQAEGFTNSSGLAITSDVEGIATDVVAINAWDWASYPEFNLPADGKYTLAFRVSSMAGATLQIEEAGVGVVGTLQVPATGNRWITLYKTFDMTAGTHAIGLKPIEGNLVIDWFSVSSRIEILEITSSSSSSTSSVSNSSVVSGSYPITIEAESFSNMDGVNVTSDTDDGVEVTAVSSFGAWEWMSYSVISLPSSGTHTISYRVKSSGPVTLQLEEAGVGAYGSIEIPSTEGEWQTVHQTLDLESGQRSFGLKVTAGTLAINWFSVECSSCASSSASSVSSSSSTASLISSSSSAVGEPGKSGGGSSSLWLLLALLLPAANSIIKMALRK